MTLDKDDIDSITECLKDGIQDVIDDGDGEMYSETGIQDTATDLIEGILSDLDIDSESLSKKDYDKVLQMAVKGLTKALKKADLLYEI